MISLIWSSSKSTEGWAHRSYIEENVWPSNLLLDACLLLKSRSLEKEKHQVTSQNKHKLNNHAQENSQMRSMYR